MPDIENRKVAWQFASHVLDRHVGGAFALEHDVAVCSELALRIHAWISHGIPVESDGLPEAPPDLRGLSDAVGRH